MKIWIDACEPKTVIMLKPLYDSLKNDHEIYITSRDFDSTLYLLDKFKLPHIKVGKHGGGTKLGKLESYVTRLQELMKITEEENPDFLFCLASPEALRVAFGLGIPNIVFNDEPRSVGVVKLTLPLAEQIIVPKCIPEEWYLKYIDDKEKLIRFNGIDEVGWLSDFQPNEEIIQKLNLEKEKYVVCRTEPAKAQYLAEKMKSHETQLTEIIPELIKQTSEIKFILLPRYKEQFENLDNIFKHEERVLIYLALDDLAQIMYFSRLVISGGGTMVRESALLGIPSIEFFPLDTYPQETFLIENNFPLEHLKNTKDIIAAALKYIKKDFRMDTNEKVATLENPVKIAITEFKKRYL